jgi:hypothetical protein
LPLAALLIDRFADYRFADLPLSNFAALKLTLPLTLPLSSVNLPVPPGAAVAINHM